MCTAFLYGLRKLRNEKLSSVVFVVLLTVGISTNAVIGGLLNSIALKPLPVTNPGNLFLLSKNMPQQLRPDTSLSYKQFESLLERKDLFTDAVAEQVWSEGSPLRLEGASRTRLLHALVVSPNYFSSLGLTAKVGRVLLTSDAQQPSTIPVLLSYRFQREQFPDERSVLSRTIRVNKVPFVVVGVLPRNFHSFDMEREPDLWFPISAVAAFTGHTVDDNKVSDQYAFQILARLAPRVTPERSAALITPQMQAIDELEWRERSAAMSPPVAPTWIERIAKDLHEYRLALTPGGHGVSELRAKFSQALYLLSAGSLVLWLMVCSSIGGLLLAKGAARSRELSIRLVLGAGKLRIVWELFLENLLLVAVAVLLGAGLAYQLSAAVYKLLPEVRGLDQQLTPKIISITPDLGVALAVLALSLVSVLGCGVIPAARAKITSDLIGSPSASTRKTPGLLMLIASQIAFATLLLIFAALFLRTFWSLSHTDPGFDSAHILEFSVDLKSAGYSETQARTFLDNLQRQLASLPGVRSTAFAELAVMRGVGIKTTLAPQDEVLPRSMFLNTSLNGVTPGYFQTMGIPLLYGRNFESSDIQSRQPHPIVVNRAFTDLFFHGGNALGKLMVSGFNGKTSPSGIIVGVVENAKYRSLREQNAPVSYTAVDLATWSRPVILYVRTDSQTASVLAEVQGLIHKLDPSIPIPEIATLEQQVERSLWQERLVTLLSGLFGLAAFVLGTAGIYGALGYSVLNRVRELGIRVALGAAPLQIVRTIYWQIAVAVSIGLVFGSAIALLLVRYAASLLYGVSTFDPASFGGAVTVVALGACMAGVQPTWRLLRIDPYLALRSD